jgi:hypothetical protein
LANITIPSYNNITKVNIYILSGLAIIIALNIILITIIKIKLDKRVQVIIKI